MKFLNSSIDRFRKAYFECKSDEILIDSTASIMQRSIKNSHTAKQNILEYLGNMPGYSFSFFNYFPDPV